MTNVLTKLKALNADLHKGQLALLDPRVLQVADAKRPSAQN